MAYENVPATILAEALAYQVGTIQGLAVHTKQGRAIQRTIARVYPMRSTYETLYSDAQRQGTGFAHGLTQLEVMQFEIALRVTDLVRRDQVFAYQEAIVRVVSNFQPYLGLMGDTFAGLSPFIIVGSARDQTIKTKDSPIAERVLTAQCMMQRLDGLPPKFVENTAIAVDKANAVDVYGYDAWEVG
jgi:hypothetical protein